MSMRPTFNAQISFGNIVTLIVVVFGLGGGYVTVQRDIAENTLGRQEMRAEMTRFQGEMQARFNATLADINRKLDAQSANDRAQDITLGRQDERMALILQGIAEVKATLEQDRRDRQP